jgi:hypothetical protein
MKISMDARHQGSGAGLGQSVHGIDNIAALAQEDARALAV